MIIKISNSKISKSGKSLNFFSDNKNYSLKINLLPYQQNYQQYNGKMIKIIAIEKVGNWNMIKSFKFIDKIQTQKNAIEKPKDNSYFSGGNSQRAEYPKNNYSQEFLSELRKYETIHNYEENILIDNNPLHNKDNVYSHSYNGDINYRMIAYNISKTANNDSLISVIQNIFSRGENVNKILSASTSITPIISIMLLELIKTNNENIEIKINKYFKSSIKHALEEIKVLFGIFNKISKTKIKNNLNITIKEQSAKNKITFLSKGKKLMEIGLVKDVFEEKISPSFLSKKLIKYNNLINFQKEINSLLVIVFNYNNKISKLKPEQIKMLNIIVNKQESSLAVLKTGFGKSLIYQYATMFQPTIFISVFPIISLISDQQSAIENDFRLKHSIQNESLKKIKNNYDLSQLLNYKRLFLITPERLENESIQALFNTIRDYVSYMVFDEAHCVSEWGHDFRPSYLMARYMLDNLKEDKPIIAIALTATAAPHIKNDVSKLLKIKRENVINIADGSGLERKELEYKFIYEDNIEFDRWNRSELYADLVDKKIISAQKKYEQSIVFFMKAGDFSNTKEDSINSKNAAAEAYIRNQSFLTDKALYTGKTKLLNNNSDENIVRNINNFANTNMILATKSFGMGINLSKCDYVLLTEPPYSLEDLYQQSGRAGRMGQKSKIEIMFSENSMGNPLSKYSPYNFFLEIKEKRVSIQKMMFMEIIEFMIDSDSKYISIDFRQRNNYYREFARFVIAHMITEFDFIEKYHTKYGRIKGQRGVAITNIIIKKSQNNIFNTESIIQALNTKLQRYAIEKEYSLEQCINSFYDYYFEKLQSDKLIGINILINFLKKDEFQRSNNHSQEILTILNNYYKSRSSKVDVLSIDIFKLMNNKTSQFTDIIALIKNNLQGINSFELMEAVSRYAIDKSYIDFGSILISHLTGESMLGLDYKKINDINIKSKHLSSLYVELYNELMHVDGKMNKEVKVNMINNIMMKNKQLNKNRELFLQVELIRRLNARTK